MNEIVTFEDALDQAIDTLGGPANEVTPKIPVAARRRRAVTSDDYSSLATLTLVEDEGMLRWVYTPPPRLSGRRRAFRRAIPAVDGNTVKTIPIHDLPKNKVLQGIADLDASLTPNQGLRIWRNDALQKFIKPKPGGKRALLFVHGTFSKSDMFFTELKATPEGRTLLADLETTYDGGVLAFDHPTLSVSPWINALDLERQIAGVDAKIDVVCHSRGGLVAAWWLRLGARKVGNVMFVGSPLAGTSLASPAALRQALDHLATAAKAIAMTSGIAATVVPFMTVVTGIAKAVGGVLQLGADLPIADAAVVTVPGLASQSRVSNNAEMLRLFASSWPTQPKFHAVTGNFKPVESDAGWMFWRRLTNIGDQLKHGAADLIFDGPNDLVVDTGSMQGPLEGDRAGADLDLLARLAFDTRITPFLNSPNVHHTNYFRQPETIKAIRAML